MTDLPVSEIAGVKANISKDDLNTLPMISWTGPIELIETHKEARAAVKILQEETLLGFDTETRPSFKKGEYYPPSLMQLATADRVWLFRICRLGTLDPLLPLLEDEAILKTGVAINDDVKELRKMQEFAPAGFLEITRITAPLGIEARGLRPLCGILMGGRISKKAQVSNWAREQLDEKQISYAATDAWISRELYVRACALQERLSKST